ncbi:MAG: hypothetical protein K6F99_04030 [Lachnospiraceae bacterium]|nr:hypothetical protein [Lachnospiraceae bacterium]
MKKESIIKNLIKRAGALVLAATLTAVSIPAANIHALFNPDKAITYREFKSKYTVETSSIFLGTYIVQKDALTDDIYKKAVKSGSKTGQQNTYYKSELSDDSWVLVDDIDNGIKGLSSESVPVAESVLDPLYVQYFMGADGILMDALTGLPVNPFDIPDPYDLTEMEELQPLWMQYTMSDTKADISQEDFLKNRNSEGSGHLRSDVYYYQLLNTFFSLDLRDDETNDLDKKLSKLNVLYNNLKKAGNNDEAQVVYGLMKKVDASRRAIIMAKLSQDDVSALNTLLTLGSGDYYTSEGNFKDSSDDENTSGDEKYITELKDSLKHDFTKSSKSSLAWLNKWLSKLGITKDSDGWWTVLEQAQSRKSSSISSSAKAAEEESDDDVKIATVLSEENFNIDNNIISAISESMGNCDESYNTHIAESLKDVDKVLGHAEYQYSVSVIEDSTTEELGGPITYLKHVLNIRDNNIIDASGELSLLKSSLLSLVCNKYTNSVSAGVNDEYNEASTENSKQAALNSEKAATEDIRMEVQYLIRAASDRDSAAEALAYVQGRITWAEGLFDQVKNDAYKTNANASINALILWLKEEAQRIIDSDASLKSELDKLKDKKADLQEQRDAALDDNDLAGAKLLDAKIAAVDQDIADAGGDDGSDIVDKAKKALAEDPNADVSGMADALAGLGDEDGLNDLLDAAKDMGADTGDIKDALDNVDKKDGALSEDDLLNALLDFFGKGIDEMSAKELAIATTGLSRYGRSGVEPANKLARELAQRGRSLRNPYFFNQYTKDKTIEGISLKTVGDVTEYRYFYDDSKRTSTMTYGAKIYVFKNGSASYSIGKDSDKTENLTEKIVFSTVPYIAEADATNIFKCDTEYVSGSQTAVIVTSSMQSPVENLISALEEL